MGDGVNGRSLSRERETICLLVVEGSRWLFMLFILDIPIFIIFYESGGMGWHVLGICYFYWA